MEKVFDEKIAGSNSDINCSKTHKEAERYEISVIEMAHTVINPC